MKAMIAFVLSGAVLLPVGCAKKEKAKTTDQAAKLESLRKDAEEGLAEVEAMLKDIEAFEKSRGVFPGGPPEIEIEPRARGVDMTGGGFEELEVARGAEPEAVPMTRSNTRSGGGKKKPNWLDKGYQKQLDEKAQKAKEAGAATAKQYKQTLREIEEAKENQTFLNAGADHIRELEQKAKDLRDKAHDQYEDWQGAKKSADDHAKEHGIR